MGIAQLLAVLKARRKGLFMVWGGVVLLALVVSLALPRQYTASTEVVVESRGSDPLVVQPGHGATTPGFLATQADIIASERVGGRAVAALKLGASPRWSERWQTASGGQGDVNRWIAGRLKKGVKVSPSHESNVLTVTVTADDPSTPGRCAPTSKAPRPVCRNSSATTAWLATRNWTWKVRASPSCPPSSQRPRPRAPIPRRASARAAA